MHIHLYILGAYRSWTRMYIRTLPMRVLRDVDLHRPATRRSRLVELPNPGVRIPVLDGNSVNRTFSLFLCQIFFCRVIVFFRIFFQKNKNPHKPKIKTKWHVKTEKETDWDTIFFGSLIISGVKSPWVSSFISSSKRYCTFNVVSYDCVSMCIKDYCVTCLEPKVSTNISYCDFILLKSWPPGPLEKSSITDQVSFLTPSCMSRRQNCRSNTLRIVSV